MQQVALRAWVQVGRQAGTADDPASDGVIEIIATQSAVAAGREHFKHTAGQAQDRNIEGTAAQVINSDQAFSVLIEAVGHSRRSRLVEQAQHVQAGKFRRILGGLTLGIIEIRRNGDNRPYQLTTQGVFRTLAQHLEDIGRHFHRALGPLDSVNERHMGLAADKAVRQLVTQLLDVGQPTTHQALDRQHRVQGVCGRGELGRFAHFSAVGVITHGRRQDHLPIGVGQRFGQAAAQGSNQGIGGAQVNPDRQATLVRLRALAGFGDLQ